MNSGQKNLITSGTRRGAARFHSADMTDKVLAMAKDAAAHGTEIEVRRFAA